MTVRELIDTGKYRIINEADTDRTIDKIFCCDLLSIAMGKAPSDCAWITVMANINTLAVASLADVAVVVLAEGSRLDEAAVAKAAEQSINVIATDDPIFETGVFIKEKMNA